MKLKHTHTLSLVKHLIHSLTSAPFSQSFSFIDQYLHGKTDMMLNTCPFAPVLTSVVCLATARGKDKRFSRTGRAIHILQLPYPSFGHSKEAGGRGRESRHDGREGLGGGEREGYERK